MELERSLSLTLMIWSPCRSWPVLSATPPGTRAEMKTPGPSRLPTRLRPRPLPAFLARLTVRSWWRTDSGLSADFLSKESVTLS